MTDNHSAVTAAELDELQSDLTAAFNGKAPMTSGTQRRAAHALASLRKQLAEALMQASGDKIILARALDQAGADAEHDEKVIEALRADNAKKDAALGMLRGIATRCEHDGNVYLAVVAEDIREALQYAALTPASQEAPASHAPAETEMLRALDRMASGDCEEVNPASPSPGLRDAVIEECAKVAELEGSDHDTCVEIAAAIRALASRPVSEREG